MILTALCMLTATHLSAQQQPFSTIEYVDVNNIKASVLVHGDMNWNPFTSTNECEFPKNSGKNLMSATTIWMSGYDAGNNLRVSAQTYRQSGNDYWPGPLDANATLSYSTSQDWARVWKVNFFDINNHLANATHTAGNTPADIWEWPAKGNPNAKGNNGASLTINNDMAPYVDANNDGKYNAADGDYPDIKGDQMLWWVFSDNGPTHDNHSNGSPSVPLMTEVHATVYAYKRGGLLDNIVYYEFDIMNRSADDLSDFCFAINADADLGFFRDDYIGFDSARRLGYAYNGSYPDGNGQPDAYGNTPPVAGYTLLTSPGDNGNNLEPAGSFMYFNNDFSVAGNPLVDTEYNGYMRATFRDGMHLKSDFVGKGTPTTGRGSGPDLNYVYPGDPADTSAWSECSSYNPVGDRRFVLTSADAQLNKGSSLRVAYALVVAEGDSTSAFPYCDVSGIKVVTDTAWKNYRNPPKSFVSVEALTQGKALGLFPNPAKDRLYISTPFDVDAAGYQLFVYDMAGRKTNVVGEWVNNRIEVNTASLAPGVYHIVYRDADVSQSASFVKE